LTDVTIDDNRADAPNATADQGGGLFLNKSADLRNVTISNNQAVRAPGSTFGPEGGGVFDNGSPPSTWTNVTVSGNQASGSGSQGGGIFYNADANTATYTNVTVAGNSSDGSEGGGIFINDELTWGNTIFAGNTAAGAK